MSDGARGPYAHLLAGSGQQMGKLGGQHGRGSNGKTVKKSLIHFATDGCCLPVIGHAKIYVGSWHCVYKIDISIHVKR